MAAGDLNATVPVSLGRRNRHAGGRLQPDGGADPRAAAIRSSANLLVAQQTTEAAIDSLYDPVLVTDSRSVCVTRINPAAERAVRRASGRARPARSARSPAIRGIAQAVADVLRLAGTVASGERRPRWCRGRSTAPGGRSASRSTPMSDADARLGRRRHAAGGHHAPEPRSAGSSPSSSPTASHELRTPLTSVQMGHPPRCSRARAGHARRERQQGHPAGLPRGYHAARSADARAAGSLEDRIRAPSTPVFAPVAPVGTHRRRSHRAAPPPGGSAWHPSGRRRATGPLRPSSVDRAQIERVIANLVTNADARDASTAARSPSRQRNAAKRSRSRSPTPALVFRASTCRRRSSSPFVQVPHGHGRRRGARPDDLSDAIVEAHGGQLTVQSSPGQRLQLHVHCSVSHSEAQP